MEWVKYVHNPESSLHDYFIPKTREEMKQTAWITETLELILDERYSRIENLSIARLFNQLPH